MSDITDRVNRNGSGIRDRMNMAAHRLSNSKNANVKMPEQEPEPEHIIAASGQNMADAIQATAPRNRDQLWEGVRPMGVLSSTGPGSNPVLGNPDDGRTMLLGAMQQIKPQPQAAPPGFNDPRYFLRSSFGGASPPPQKKRSQPGGSGIDGFAKGLLGK